LTTVLSVSNEITTTFDGNESLLSSTVLEENEKQVDPFRSFLFGRVSKASFRRYRALTASPAPSHDEE
jgi:hypothetical protein